MPFRDSPTEWYVSSAGNDTTGDGTIGTPYATLQKVFTEKTHDTTNGTRINIKGVTDVTTTFDTSTYGSPTVSAPLAIQGYDTTAGDGGVGTLDGGGGAFNMWNGNAQSYVAWIDLEFRNINSSNIFLVWSTAGFNCIRCVFHDGGSGVRNTTGAAGSAAINCVFYDLAGAGISLRVPTVYGCYFDGTSTKNFSTYAAYMGDSANSTCMRSIFKLTGSGRQGIYLRANGANAIGNVIFADTASTNQAAITGYTSYLHGIVADNILSGFSGTGSYGIDNSNIVFQGGNVFYNCTTEVATAYARVLQGAADVSAAAEPLVDPSNDDFRCADFVRRLSAFSGTPYGLAINNYMNPGAYQDRLTVGLPR